jgi:hypothetical protein
MGLLPGLRQEASRRRNLIGSDGWRRRQGCLGCRNRQWPELLGGSSHGS